MNTILRAILISASIFGVAWAEPMRGPELAAKVEHAYRNASYNELSLLIAWRLDPTIPSSKEGWETTTKNQMKAYKGQIAGARFYTKEEIALTIFRDSPVNDVKEPVIGYVVVTKNEEDVTKKLKKNSWVTWPVIETRDGARLVAAPWK